MPGSAMAGQPGSFDGEERLNALSAAGDPLDRLVAIIDFEVFRSDLESGLAALGSGQGWAPTL
jgi:transposase, IS5 family